MENGFVSIFHSRIRPSLSLFSVFVHRRVAGDVLPEREVVHKISLETSMDRIWQPFRLLVNNEKPNENDNKNTKW